MHPPSAPLYASHACPRSAAERGPARHVQQHALQQRAVGGLEFLDRPTDASCIRFLNSQQASAAAILLVKQGIVEIRAGDQVLDEIMIFDRALTDTEIKALYKSNAP